MVREGYKETELGEIPEEWVLSKIKELSINITVGFVGTMSFLFVEKGVPVLRGQNVLPNRLDLTNLKYITPKTHELWKKSSLNAGDVVLVRVGYPGTACIIPEGMGNINAASLVIVKPNRTKIYPLFLCYSLNSPLGKKQIQLLLVGGAQQVVNTHTAAEINLFTPPLPEQHRIATVLGTIDECIEKTEALIAKLNSVKAGLMQDLLTRGIDAEGRIREESTHEFKDTEIGRVPVEWDVVQLFTLSQLMVNGGTPSTKVDLYWKGDIPWITGADVIDHKIKDIRRFITDQAVNNSSTNIIPKNNLIIVTRTGVGKYAISPFDVAISQDITGFILNEKVDIQFLFCIFSKIISNISKYAQGTSINGITRETLGNAMLAIPQISEQRNISTILSAVENRITNEEQYREKLLNQKQGLMADLLTGKVRVLEGIV